MKKPLHILFLARWYPHRYDNMYGLFVKRHAEAAALKHRISVFYVHAVPMLPVRYEVEVNKGLINEYFCYYRPATSGPGFIKTLVNGWKFIKAHLKLARKIPRPDLLHVHVLTRLGVIAYIIQKIQNIPYIITEHWSRYQPGNRGYEGSVRQYLTRLVTRNARALTTVTTNLYQSMQLHGIHNENQQVLLNVVDTKIFFPLSYSPIKPSPQRLIHVSCFDNEPKNISGMLQAVKELAGQRTDFVMDLVGTGKDWETLKKLAEDLGLLDTVVFFTGQLEGKELANKIRNSQGLVLFSRYENMPVVINEAFCCGIPVISSDVGGIKEIVNDSNGILVPAGNQESLVLAMNTLLNEPERFDRNWISKEASAHFSKTAVAETLDAIYQKSVY